MQNELYPFDNGENAPNEIPESIEITDNKKFSKYMSSSGLKSLFFNKSSESISSSGSSSGSNSAEKINGLNNNSRSELSDRSVSDNPSDILIKSSLINSQKLLINTDEKKKSPVSNVDDNENMREYLSPRIIISDNGNVSDIVVDKITRKKKSPRKNKFVQKYGSSYENTSDLPKIGYFRDINGVQDLSIESPIDSPPREKMVIDEGINFFVRKTLPKQHSDKIFNKKDKSDKSIYKSKSDKQTDRQTYQQSRRFSSCDIPPTQTTHTFHTSSRKNKIDIGFSRDDVKLLNGMDLLLNLSSEKNKQDVSFNESDFFPTDLEQSSNIKSSPLKSISHEIILKNSISTPDKSRRFSHSDPMIVHKIDQIKNIRQTLNNIACDTIPLNILYDVNDTEKYEMYYVIYKETYSEENDKLFCTGMRDKIYSFNLVSQQYLGKYVYYDTTTNIYTGDKISSDNDKLQVYILFSQQWHMISKYGYYPVYIICSKFEISLPEFVDIYPNLIYCILNKK